MPKNIPTVQLDVERAATEHRLFPDEIEPDEWMLFHGTSAHHEEQIEHDGLNPNQVLVSVDQLRRVSKIYQSMGWSGEDFGGYAILKPYSLDYERLTGTIGPRLYLAESSTRALLYATRDFSGGEKARATRRAIADLKTFLADPEVRERHREYMSHPVGTGYSIPDEVDLAWLESSLRELADVQLVVDEPFRHFSGGLVYALRLTKEDLPSLFWHRSMGVEAYTTIPPSRIVAKVIVPSTYEMNFPGRLNKEYMKRLDIGIWAALIARGRERSVRPD